MKMRKRMIVFVCIAMFGLLWGRIEEVEAFEYDSRICFYLEEIHEPAMGANIGDEYAGFIKDGVYTGRRTTVANYDGDLYLHVVFYETPVTFTLTASDSAGKVLKNVKVPATDGKWSKIQNVYTYMIQVPLDKAQSLELQMQVLESDLPTPTVRYKLDTYQYETVEAPKVVKGFKEKLTVAKRENMNLAVAKWESSNPSVVTVDSKGNLIGKKIGEATVTVYFANGTHASKQVKVIPNEYTNAKLKKKEVKKGNSALKVHSVSYDKKGNLVIKARFINRQKDPMVYVSDISVKVKDKKGKLVGKYDMKKMSSYPTYYLYLMGTRLKGPFKRYDFKSNSVKTVTLKIPKKKLKQKKALLQNAQIDTNVTVYTYEPNPFAEMVKEGRMN